MAIEKGIRIVISFIVIRAKSSGFGPSIVAERDESTCYALPCLLLLVLSLAIALYLSRVRADLGKDADTKVGRVVESQALVQRRNRLNLLRRQVPVGAVQVLLEPLGIVGLGNDNNVPLGGPAKEHLRRCLAVGVGGLLDGWVFKQGADVEGALVLELEEGLWPKGGIGCHGNIVLLAHLNETRLDEVRVVFDLVDGGLDFGVWRLRVLSTCARPCSAVDRGRKDAARWRISLTAQHVVEEHGVEVGYTNGA